MAAYLLERSAVVRDLHLDIHRPELAQNRRVDVVRECDGPRRGGGGFIQRAGGERLAAVDQFDACDCLFGAELLLLHDLDRVVRGRSVFSRDDELDLLPERHVAGFSRGGPVRVVAEAADGRVVGAGELQEHGGEVGRVHIGRERERDQAALAAGRALVAERRPVGCEQLRAQRLFAAGLTGVEHEMGLGRDGTAGCCKRGHDERRLVCVGCVGRGRDHSVVRGRDLPPVELVARGGRGRQRDGLAFKNGRKRRTRGRIQRCRGSAHTGAVLSDRYVDRCKMPFFEVRDDLHVLTADFQVEKLEFPVKHAAHRCIGKRHVIRIIGYVHTVAGDLPAEELVSVDPVRATDRCPLCSAGFEGFGAILVHYAEVNVHDRARFGTP